MAAFSALPFLLLLSLLLSPIYSSFHCSIDSESIAPDPHTDETPPGSIERIHHFSEKSFWVSFARRDL